MSERGEQPAEQSRPPQEQPPPRPPRDPDLELIGYIERADPRHAERR